MRVLFTFAGGSGHAEPMVPIGNALVAAGHTVAFTGASKPIQTLAARGFATLQLGDSPTPASAAPTTLQPLVEPDQQHEEDVVRDAFAARAPRRRAPLYTEMFAAWRPDLVVRDEMDFGSAIVAEALGVPRAMVVVIAAGGFARPDVVAEPLDALRAELGLPADPDLNALADELVLCPFPPNFRHPAFPLSSNALYFRADASKSSAAAMPRWFENLDDRPLVYVTLGTIFPLESGDLFPRLLAGLADLPINVITTVGRDLDPAALGLQPPNVHVEQWLPQEVVLSRADLVVSHGGSGTVLAALTHGVPQILTAMGADQMLNAKRVEALGVGRSLHPITITPTMVRDAATALLDDAGVRMRVERMQSEIAGLPSPETVIPSIESLALPT